MPCRRRWVNSLVGACLFTFAEPDRAPAQAVFGDDGIVTVIDAVGNRGAGVWTPDGPQGGVIAVVAQESYESGRSPQITILHGRIDVGTPGDATTLVCTYTVEPVDGSRASSETAAPFTGTGQSLDHQLIVQTLE